MNDTPRIQILATETRFERAPIYAPATFNEITKEFVIGTKRYKATLEKRDMRNGGDHWVCEESDIMPLRLVNDEEFAFEHGSKYDPSAERDKLLIQIAKDSGYIASDKQSINPSVHRMYIRDEVAESTRVVQKGKRVHQALTKVYALTAQEQADFAFFMQKPVRGLTEEQINAYCVEVAMEKPDIVLKNLTDNDWKLRAFLEKCVQFGLIVQVGPSYKYGAEVIGMDQDTAIAYFKRKENKELARLLAGKLKELGAPMPGTPQVTEAAQETPEKTEA